MTNGQTDVLTIIASITGTGTIKNTASTSRSNAIEYDWNSNNNAQTKIIQNSGYNPKVDIRVQQYPWYYNADTNTYQYQYQNSNTPVFTVDIRNNGPDDATGVVIDYKIGNGLKYQGYSTSIGTVTYANNELIWNIGFMPNGGKATMKVFTTILESGTNTPDLTNTATLTNVDQQDTNSANNQATCSLIVPKAADIGVTQSYTTYTDNNIQYAIITIQANNNGPDSATNVQINDILPTGLTFQSANTSTGTYNPTTGIWNIGTMTNGDTETISITAILTQAVKNTANTNRSASTEYDWNSNNNSKTIPILTNNSAQG